MKRALQASCFVLVASMLAGCAASLSTVAAHQAERELACSPPALLMRGVGELRVGRTAHPDWNVELYEASGCEKEQLYFCARGARDCVHAIDALPWPDAHPAIERALSLLRTVARARCPQSALGVVAESESLFRFEACDGSWLYHCRARGCERLR